MDKNTLEYCTKKETDVYMRTISHYGHKEQIAQTISEMGELSEELAFYLARCDIDNSIGNIIDEIADVYNMLRQLTIIFSCGDIIKDRMKLKMNREMERIGNEILY